MLITDQTIAKLKNFSTINESILIKKGSKIQTIHPQQLIVAETVVTEKFNTDFAIYELSKFIASLSIFKPEEREVEFFERYCIIGKGKSKIKYWFCEPSMIVAAPYKTISFPEPICEVEIADMSNILKAASIIQAPDCTFVGDGSDVQIICDNRKDKTAHSYSRVVGTTDQEFSFSIKVENIRVIDLRYQIKIATKNIIEFSGNEITYWLARSAE